MMGGTAAQCWFEEEMPTIKYLADLNKMCLTPVKVIKNQRGNTSQRNLCLTQDVKQTNQNRADG